MNDDFFDVDDGLIDALARGKVSADDAVGHLLVSWAAPIQADAARAASSFSLAVIEARAAALAAAGGAAAGGAAGSGGAAGAGSASAAGAGSASAASAGSGGADAVPSTTSP